MTVENFLERLRGVRKSGQGWEAFCPAHPDREKRSLSVGVADDGKILLRCFVGCTAGAIVTALQLRQRDLFPEKDPRPDLARAEIECAYDYVDERGTVLYQTIRFKPKAFRPRRPDGQGGWTWNLQGVRRVVYRLPALAEATCVYLCEGEKDADALAAWGLASTTTQGGAAQWHDEYIGQFKALTVEGIVILPDNDEAGAEYAAKATASLMAAGFRVKVVRLPGLAHKGDVFDWIAAGGTREALRAIIDETPWLQAPQSAAATSVHLGVVLDELLATLDHPETPAVATPFADLTDMLNGGLGAGELCYLGAFAGIGKTALMIEWTRYAAKHGTAVLVLSREMTNLAVARRLVAQEAEISAAGLKRGVLGDGDRSALTTRLPKMRQLPIWLNQVAVSFPELDREIASFASSPRLGLLVVDYLQLLRAEPAEGRGRRDRRLEIEAVSRGLKELALRYRLPVICASSMARPPRAPAGKKPSERRPEIDLLRESGELEHDADIVLLLHRGFGATTAECIVAKNRDGRVGVVRLEFQPEFVAFREPRQKEGEA